MVTDVEKAIIKELDWVESEDGYISTLKTYSFSKDGHTHNYKFVIHYSKLNNSDGLLLSLHHVILPDSLTEEKQYEVLMTIDQGITIKDVKLSDMIQNDFSILIGETEVSDEGRVAVLEGVMALAPLIKENSQMYSEELTSLVRVKGWNVAK